MRGGGAVGIHPVHAILGDEGHEGLGELFDGLVECFGGRVAFFAQHFVLCGEDPLDGAHEGAAFAGQVAVHFFSEIGFEKISAADSDAEGDDAVLCFAGGVLEDGIAAVKAAALEEHSSQRGTGAFGGDEENVDILGGDDAGLFVKGDAEAMGEVEGFAGGKVFLYRRPELDLGGVAEEVADDGAFFERFFDLEEGFAGHEAIAYCFIPGLGVFPLTDYDVDAVVFLVERLAGALNAVADDGDGFIFQYLLCFGERKFFAGDYIFFNSAEI